jgi:outer membrane protein assembly factor BamB
LLTLSAGDWPEFRGPERDSRLRGVRIDTDWSAHPPKQVWRQRVGPGWSSFAVIGDRLFTQEQRGDEEAVVCYDATTGQERWAHLDKTRFWEVVGGAGPRATPTFHDGKLYTLGANGMLNCLDPITGKRHWSADIVADSGAKVPMWGFSSSPLVIDDKAIVFAGGPNGKAVVAYAIQDGKLAWAAGEGTHSYSSAQIVRLDDTPQVLMMSDVGLAGYDPADGKVLWHHDWSMEGMARIVQPLMLTGNRIVIGSGAMMGARMITVSHKGDGWNAEEGWTTNDVKPYFNDFVSRDGTAYGFDGAIFCAVDLETGKRKWKKGR